MKLPSLISKVLQKVAPMTTLEHSDISTNMEVWFDKKKEEAQNKKNTEKELNILDKGILMLDEWYMRAIFACLFVYLVRIIQDWMSPADDPHDDPEPYDFDEERRLTRGR